jgi:RNA polymerase sigma factor FliA
MRDDLILGNLATVKTLAGKMHSRIPRHSIANYDDLVQYGALGLIAASRKFNRRKRVPFAQYCRHRIKGAIIDGLRAVDDLSRTQRKAQRALDDPLTFDVPRNHAVAPEYLPSRDADPEELALATERSTALYSACATLQPRDRLILRLYYAHGRTMKEIGAVIGVNESRVSQLHARALSQLKQALRGLV